MDIQYILAIVILSSVGPRSRSTAAPPTMQADPQQCQKASGAIALTERTQDHCQIHVVRNWCYLGSVSDLSKARELDEMAVGFDADGYKILCQPILSGSADITLL